MQHERTAGQIEAKRLPQEAEVREDENAKRSFVLHIVQPGLVGLMDGSVSTLAAIFCYKLVIALAHKLARIAWGVLHHGRDFEMSKLPQQPV